MAQSDRAVVRAQLTATDSRVSCKPSLPYVISILLSNFLFSVAYKLPLISFSVLESQLQALHIAAADTTNAVNTRGDTVVARLQDTRNHVREVAWHGAHQGTAVAIAVVQTMFRTDYRTFQPVLPVAGEEQEDFYELVDDLSIVADAVAEEINLDVVISNIFNDE